jgi:hypothetical protein
MIVLAFASPAHLNVAGWLSFLHHLSPRRPHGHLFDGGSAPNCHAGEMAQRGACRRNVGLRLFGKEFEALVAKKLRDPEWRELRVGR